MYGRNINFTLLAPSLWAVVEAIAFNVEEDKYKRMLFKTGENSGFIIEVFDSISSYNTIRRVLTQLSLFLSK